jgi:hypothetical protein
LGSKSFAGGSWASPFAALDKRRLFIAAPRAAALAASFLPALLVDLIWDSR